MTSMTSAPTFLVFFAGVLVMADANTCIWGQNCGDLGKLLWYRRQGDSGLGAAFAGNGQRGIADIKAAFLFN